MNWPEAVSKITTVILDIDGVMTDGRIGYGDHENMKFFSIQDGHAIKMAIKAGYKLGVISGRADAANKRRTEELGFHFVCLGEANKLEALHRCLNENNLEADECIFMGDDVIDIKVMKSVGIGVAVHNAVDEVKAHADVITKACGGNGAVREILVRLMKDQERWDEAMQAYLP
ncbi:MAG: HAD hydrolase family protein [Lentisphaeria bacterium]|nr:HAD hydrolase family protein [Lentisphaeria bacterium]NQZ71125.1 HAD hydrolase family protein [Lentisphaeria bacterium]